MTIPYQTALEKATTLLKMPHTAWKKLNVHEQHDLFFFLFQEKLSYSITEGYQTAEILYAARLFEDFAHTNSLMVDTGENTSNPVIDYLTRFWKYYQACPALQNILIKG